MEVMPLIARISQLIHECKDIKKHNESSTLAYSCNDLGEVLTFKVFFKVKERGISSRVERSISFHSWSKDEWIIEQIRDIHKYLKGETTAHELFSS